MPDLDEATRTQIRNIETSTGRSMDDWVALVGASGRTKHGEIVAWLKSEHGLAHGNANLIALTALRGRRRRPVTPWSMRSMPAPRRSSGRSTTR